MPSILKSLRNTFMTDIYSTIEIVVILFYINNNTVTHSKIVAIFAKCQLSEKPMSGRPRSLVDLFMVTIEMIDLVRQYVIVLASKEIIADEVKVKLQP